ncbi:AMP-binding protein [Emcibacter sp. SYSU 3D8]|uniref:class I adenylate-forming enzyme family protein n=1 Tax=Emcibacter sp. SYSU 3D8 TaxID=3133969 RepID=UPI0031FE54AB
MRQILDAPSAFLPHVWANHARHFPMREAIVCGPVRWTWRQFNETMNRVANGLLDLGAGQGDKVAVVMSNSAEMAAVLYGIIKSGACVVPVSAMLSSEQILGMIEDSGAQALFADAHTRPLIEPVMDRLQRIRRNGFFAHGFEADGWRGLAGWLALQDTAEPDAVYSADDEVNIIYSSGTTGLPKGIVMSHAARLHFAWSNAIEMRFSRRSRALVTTALYSNGTWLMALPVLFAGGTLHILPSFSPQAFLETVGRERITHTFMVPTQYIVTLEHPALDGADLSSLDVMLSAGSPLRVDTKKQVIARMGRGIHELYGYSEGAATMIKPEDAETKWGSVGTPVIGFDIAIIDGDGNELPFGETGEIVARGGGVMAGYHKRPDATADLVWTDGMDRVWIRSGDIGRFDEDGFLYILDRKKDMIISGGFNVFPADIEQVVGGHPDVSDVTVIGIPHDKWGETPLALVIGKSGAALDCGAIREWANQRLAKPQRLAAVEARGEFPRNALGKIIKRALRAPYWPDAT